MAPPLLSRRRPEIASGRQVPPSALEPRRIMVPVAGLDRPSAQDAVRLACRLARRQRVGLLLVTVVEVGRSQPLSAILEGDIARAEALLGAAAELARLEDVSARTAVLQARQAGPVLVDEAARQQADLLVLGVGDCRRLGTFALGETASYVLANAPCPVILLRGPLPPESLSALAEAGPPAYE